MKSTRRNRSEIALHIIWTTWKRMPLLADETLERCVWRTIQAEAEKYHCTVLAIGGMPDHVHVVLILSPTITVAKLLNQLKGVSSSVAREHLGTDSFFG
ncbi:IS200/IS605 family transposase [Armatimonas sp.]|uniref:IS200/IS605 family transposase n=1 Tax=Armatimonas sp. TaxID=1872638 RepID=UPI00286D1282|nr:IS200/IS605 family transposase [Armatimonas sp.]